MSEHEPQRRKFQFGLRRMMIWAVVVAFYCGIGRFLRLIGSQDLTMYWGTSELTLLGCVVILAVILRRASSRRMGWDLAILLTGVAFLSCHLFEYRRFLTSDVLMPVCLWMFTIGCGHGWLVFFLVDATCRTVDWADRFMEKKTDESED